MEEKDKIIQLMDEDIIDLNDEVSDVPDDAETVDLSDFDVTSPTEDEDILDLTETVDTLSGEDDDIIDLTDTSEDDEKQDEEVLELDDFAEESSLKEEEILDTGDVAGEFPAENKEISGIGDTTEEPALEEEEIPELYTTIEDPVELKEKTFKPEDLGVETSFEEEIEDIVDDAPAEDEDITKSTELGSKMDSSEVPDLDDDDLSALFDSELDEEVDVEIIELEELDSDDSSVDEKTNELDELDGDDLDEDINFEFVDDQSSAETIEFSASEASSVVEEPTVLLDEEPLTEEPVEPEKKAFEPEDFAVETSFEEEIEDIVDDTPTEDEDVIKSTEFGSETDSSEVPDLDDDLSVDLDSGVDEETIELDELDSDDLDEDINIEFDDQPSAETAAFSSSEALSLDEEPLKEEKPAEAESISPVMVTDLGPEQKIDWKIDQEEDLKPEVEALSTEEYDQDSDASLQEDLGTKDYVVDPESISSEMIEEALEKVVSKMYSEKIESALVDVIEKKVSSEIERLKILLLEDTTGDE